MSHALQPTDAHRAAVAEALLRIEMSNARKRGKILAFKAKPIQRLMPRLDEIRHAA